VPARIEALPARGAGARGFSVGSGTTCHNGYAVGVQIDVTFVGNATTLISCGDITVLTDPNFLHQGQHAYLGYGLVSKRLHPPALTVDQLPPLDAVVLSHMHGDHWDRVAQRGLDHTLPVITTEHAAKRLKRRGFHRAIGLTTWANHVIDKGTTRLTVTALPGRHAPTPINRFLPPVIGTMLEFGPAGGGPQRRLYISGDTLLIDELAEIPVRFQSIDAGVLHLGGTRLPAGNRLPFGLTVTMTGQQGADLAAAFELPAVIPVHFDDYGVFASPLSEFLDEMTQRGLADRVLHVERGQSVTV
jgi:L-ascorbate metabolism protein UlaG (beta-lactamase superfamily)